jgi:hypothetical protein
MVLDTPILQVVSCAGCGRPRRVKEGMSHQRHSKSVMCHGVSLVGLLFAISLLLICLHFKTNEDA